MRNIKSFDKNNPLKGRGYKYQSLTKKSRNHQRESGDDDYEIYKSEIRKQKDEELRLKKAKLKTPESVRRALKE